MPRIPLHLRKLKSQMILKSLDLSTLSKRAGVDYSVACAVLNGSRISPRTLRRLRTHIESAVMPEEVHS